MTDVSELKVGDKVRIAAVGSIFHNAVGTVRWIRSTEGLSVEVSVDAVDREFSVLFRPDELTAP